MVQLHPESPASFEHIQSTDARTEEEEDWVDEEPKPNYVYNNATRRITPANSSQVSLNTSGRQTTPHSSPRKRRKPSRAGSRGPRGTSTGAAFATGINSPPPVPKLPPFLDQAATQQVSSPKPPLVLPTRHDLAHHAFQGVIWGLEYTFSIIRPAIKMLRIPLAVILFLFLVAAILNKVAPTLSAAFTPFCYIPGMSYTPMCRWTTHPPVQQQGKGSVAWPDYPALVDVQSRTFGQLMDESVARGSSSLSLDIKKTEIATADLVALIHMSDLASKESLARTLTEFVDGAKITGRGLSRLEAKMNGAIDSIMAMNDFALNAIGSARAKENEAFGLAIWRSKKPVDVVVRETFADAMDVLSEHLARLILELESNYENLQNLEETLGVLRDIVGRENKAVAEARDELLANLWTMLGGNRKDLKNFDRNLKMLKDLAVYRKHAAAHVVATLHTLQAVSQDMEDMRERVAAPSLAGSKIAPEVHMMSIKNGLERLKEGRTRTRKIEEAALKRALES